MNNMDHFAKQSDLECECISWCRASITPFTDHHPNCSKFNDSLIDVWKIEHVFMCDFCYTDNINDLLEYKSDPDIKITQEKLHKEIYDNMDEFQGF